MVNWVYYPRSERAPSLLRDVVGVFEIRDRRYQSLEVPLKGVLVIGY